MGVISRAFGSNTPSLLRALAAATARGRGSSENSTTDAPVAALRSQKNMDAAG